MKILLTGATGYIGRRLAHKFIDNETDLRLFVRNSRKLENRMISTCEIIEGSTFDAEPLAKALEGVDVAYYLIHSMGKQGDFEDLDKKSAELFRDACIDAGVKRIVYLGGLGEKESASKHLLSRIETGEVLSERSDEIDVFWFRAGVIIGSGSASFEIIRNISQKLPLMITPKWVDTKTEPIGVHDILKYLIAAKDVESKALEIVDIGAEVMSFRDMMIRGAKAMGLNRRIVKTSVLSPNISSYWLILFTPVTFSVAKALVEGLSSETVKTNNRAEELFPEITPESYEESFDRAINAIKNHQVISSWCDSSGGKVCDVPFVHNISKAVYKDRYVEDIPEGLEPSTVFDRIKAIGGAHGWHAYNILWKIRGLIDKFTGGYGLNRGRRDDDALRIGDSLDFFKVADIVDGKRLLLQAQLQLPGDGWLEYQVVDNYVILTAFFYPKGIIGRLYWYAMLPFHIVIYKKMLKELTNSED